jgi:phage shock protein A
MGILARFKEIMSANINALLDKAEDPEKMIDQYLRDLEGDLVKVKSETASVIADERAAERKLKENEEEIAKMDNYARKAVTAGNDDEARAFLSKKSQLEKEREALSQQLDICKENSTKMREMTQKLEKDITDLKGRQATLKAKLKVAETKKKLSEVGASGNNAASRIDAINKLEEKAEHMMDEADALSELNQKAEDVNVDALTAKYDSVNADVAVDDELAKLKAEMGLSEQ